MNSAIGKTDVEDDDEAGGTSAKRVTVIGRLGATIMRVRLWNGEQQLLKME
jgi:hypothetical protein